MAKVLVIDDEWNMCNVLTVGLQRHGHEVRSYTDGATAMRELGDWFPEVAVVDWQMPEMDGFACIRQLQEIHFRTKYILISDFGCWELVDNFKNHAVHATLSKPFTVHILHRTIVALLDGVSNGRRLTIRILPKTQQGSAAADYSEFGLTKREQEILKHVGSQLSAKDIAQHLGISLRTVQNHLYHINCKIQTQRREQLAAEIIGLRWETDVD